MKTHILHKCLLHNVIWKTTPNNVLKGCGCPKCLSEKITIKNKKSNEDYLNELKKKNISICPLETYINALTNILHRCSVCGYEWSAKPANILFGKSCPQCNQSKGELQIKNWLEKYNIPYEPQKIFQECKDIDYLRFDFYLPVQNKCIEYDGKQHFEPIDYFGGQKGLKYLQRHDQMKNEYCKNNDIPLLRIPYYANIDEELFNFLLN